MPWLRRSVISLSMQRPWFNRRPVHVRSVVQTVALGQVFLWVLGFYHQQNSNQHTILIHPFLLVLALYRMYQEECAVSEENMLLRLVYINITSHAYFQSWTVTQTITWRKHSLLAAPRTITVLFNRTCTLCISVYEPIAKPRQAKPYIGQFTS